MNPIRNARVHQPPDAPPPAASDQPQQQQQQQPSQPPPPDTKIPKPPHAGPADHNQHVADPLAHFLAVPWAARLLRDPAVQGIEVSDRRPLASGARQLVRGVLNGAATVRACVTFLRGVAEARRGAPAGQGGSGGGVTGDAGRLLPGSAALLRGGGPGDGEDPARPFLLFSALLDVGEGLGGFEGVMHGGALVVVLDEVMCAAASSQSDYAVTASMSVKFLKPVKLPGVVVARARVVKKEARRIYVRGSMENDGSVMAESEAVLVDKTHEMGSKL